VIVISAFFALVGFATTLKRYESRHFWLFFILMIAMVGFGAVLYVAGLRLGDLVGQPLRDLERQSSP
jgi:Kef-type K+ transport system membrane component KefB